MTILLVVLVTTVFSQDATTITAPGFPALMLVPLLLGMFAHWAKGYQRGTITVNLKDWILSGIGQTITAVIGAVGQLIAVWTANPSMFEPFQFTMAWTVFLMGYASDSALNGPKKDGV